MNFWRKTSITDHNKSSWKYQVKRQIIEALMKTGCSHGEVGERARCYKCYHADQEVKRLRIKYGLGNEKVYRRFMDSFNHD